MGGDNCIAGWFSCVCVLCPLKRRICTKTPDLSISLSRACLSQLPGDLLMPARCVFDFCIYSWDQVCVLILFLQAIVQREISIHWSLKTKWVRLKFCASASKSRLLYQKGLYLTIIFLLLCSHGCASIWEVAWTLHGHYEEEYNALWGAAGGNVWL